MSEDYTRILTVKIKMEMDKVGVDEAAKVAQAPEQPVKKVNAALVEQKVKLSDAKKGWSDMREQAEKVTSVGLRMSAVGAAITAPMLLTARQYINTVGNMEPASRKWLDASQNIERAQLRLGRTTTEILLPAYDQLGKSLDSLSQWVEANPGVAQAVLVGAGAVTAVGGALTAAGQVKSMVGTIGWLTSKVSPAAAAGKAATAAEAAEKVAPAASAAGKAAAAGGGVTAGGVIASIASGIVAGFAANEAIARTQWGQDRGFQTFGKFAAVGAGYIGTKLGGEQQGKEWFAALSDATGETKGLTQALGNLNTKVSADAQARGQAAGREAPSTAEEARGKQMYYAYREAGVEALAQYDRDRARIVADTDKRINETETQYGRQRAQVVKDFERDQAQATREFNKARVTDEKDYYADRAKRAQAFGAEVEQSERNHQKEMRRMAEDHQMRMEDAIANRDAIGALQEMRSYDLQRSRAEEDYSDEAAQRNAQYAQELQDQEAQFATKRARDLEEFGDRQRVEKEQHQARLDDMREQHRDELKTLRDARIEQLGELKTKFDQEAEARKTQLEKELTAVRIYVGKSAEEWDDYYKKLNADFEQFKRGVEPATIAPASGSVSYPEILAERKVRPDNAASYGQSSIPVTPQHQVDSSLAALASVSSAGAAAGGVVTFNANINVTGSLSDAEKREIGDIAYTQARRAQDEIFRQMGGEAW